jgi:diacylglycerol kinase family enzyme
MAFNDSDVICSIGSKILTVRTPDTDDALPSLQINPAQHGHDIKPHWHASPELLDETRFQHIHVIISTVSGTQRASAFYDTLLRPLLHELGILGRCEVTSTTSPESVTQLVDSRVRPAAREGRAQLLVLLSGDGGVSDLLNALRSAAESEGEAARYRAPELALLPLGTGNALAQSAGLAPPADPTWGLAALARGAPAPLPTFSATFSPGATASTSASAGGRETTTPLAMRGAAVCSWGLHASLVADSDGPEYRAHGAARFGMAARAALFPADGAGPHRYRGRVEVLLPPVPAPDEAGDARDASGKEEERWVAVPREEHAYVLGAMVSRLEKGFAISPSSRALDGRLWLVHFGPRGGDEVMALMGLAYQGGGHVREPGVGYEEVEGFRICFDDDDGVDPRWRRVCVDGKIVVVDPKGWVEVRKARDQVLAIRHLP